MANRWDDVAEGELATPAALNDRFNALRKGDVFNVKAYGAVGDGATDDTTPIQAAITAAVAADGTAFLPSGTYRCPTGLALSDKVEIRGAGLLQTLIHCDSATATGITINGGISGTSGVVIRDLMVYCGTGTTRSSGFGISVANCGDYLIENVYVRHGWDAVYLNADTGILSNVRIDGTAAMTGGGLNRGITIAEGCISTRLRDVYISSPSEYDCGILVESGTDTLVIDGAEVGGLPDFGLRFVNSGASHDPRWVRVRDSFFEANDSGGIGISIVKLIDGEFSGVYTKGGEFGVNVNGGRCVRFIGGSIQLAQKHGILVDACDELEIDGTLLSDNGQSANATYDGIIVAANVTDFKIKNVRSGNVIWNGTQGFNAYQRYGINVSAGTSDNYMITGCDTRGNVTSGLNDGGTGVNKVVGDNIS